MNQQALPIVDLSSLTTKNTPHRQEALAALRQAARDVGFFYLRGHGISEPFLKEVQQVTRQFFSLPTDEKESVAMIHSRHFRGYNRAGVEVTRGERDYREQFDIGAEREPITDPNAPAWAGMQGPNQWPRALPELRQRLTAWQQKMTEVALQLLRSLAEALYLPAESFDKLYGEYPNEHVKLIRYPGRDYSLSRQGVGAHKDSGFLTLLLQDNQSGLQVEVEEGQWWDVPPLAETFVVNIGELLELATNGYLRATVHRVLSPPPEHERLSIAFFLGAQLDAVVPLYCLDPALAQLAKGPTSDPQNPMRREVGWNYLKGRLRSHPEVAARFYSHLLQTKP